MYPKTLLAFHVSCAGLSLSWFEEETCLYVSRYDLSDPCAQIIPFIHEFMCRYNLPSPAWIACCRGPSSFTRVRLTLATAMGLSLGWQSTLACVTTFEAISRLCRFPGLQAMIIDAGGGFGALEILSSEDNTLKTQPVFDRYDILGHMLWDICKERPDPIHVYGDGASFLKASEFFQENKLVNFIYHPESVFPAVYVAQAVLQAYSQPSIFCHEPLYGYPAVKKLKTFQVNTTFLNNGDSP